MLEFKTTVNTNGCGYWSTVAKEVRVLGLDIPYINDEGTFGELRVYFDKSTWNVDVDGLIYTDQQFLSELKTQLRRNGFNTADITYSEMGMQGNNYVSCDVDEKFIESFNQVSVWYE